MHTPQEKLKDNPRLLQLFVILSISCHNVVLTNLIAEIWERSCVLGLFTAGETLEPSLGKSSSNKGSELASLGAPITTVLSGQPANRRSAIMLRRSA